MSFRDAGFLCIETLRERFDVTKFGKPVREARHS
jgi:hypothetical protein